MIEHSETTPLIENAYVDLSEFFCDLLKLNSDGKKNNQRIDTYHTAQIQTTMKKDEFLGYSTRWHSWAENYQSRPRIELNEDNKGFLGDFEKKIKNSSIESDNENKLIKLFEKIFTAYNEIYTKILKDQENSSSPCCCAFFRGLNVTPEIREEITTLYNNFKSEIYELKQAIYEKLSHTETMIEKIKFRLNS